MRKIAVFLLMLLGLAASFPQKVAAATECRGSTSGFNVTLPNYIQGSSHTVTFDMSRYTDQEEFYFDVAEESGATGGMNAKSPIFSLGGNQTFTNENGTVTVNGNFVTWEITSEAGLTKRSTWLGSEIDHHVRLFKHDGILDWSGDYLCFLGEFTISADTPTEVDTDTTCRIYIWQQRGDQKCYSSGCMDAGNTLTHVEVTGLRRDDGKPYSGEVLFDISDAPVIGDPLNYRANALGGSAKIDFRTAKATTYTVRVKEIITTSVGDVIPNITTAPPAGSGRAGDEICPPATFKTASETCETQCGGRESAYEGQVDSPNFKLCNQLPDNSPQKDKCDDCINGTTLGNDQRGMWTAIGCIPIEPTGIIKTFITVGLSLGGGLTLLLILAGAFRLSVSAGDPKQAEEAKEQITSAVIGLLFIIFSIVMLRFIGVQVLQIPGLGG